MTDPQAGKQPTVVRLVPYPAFELPGTAPGTLIPLAGLLQYQGRYLE